jgi:PiT family inorganic phosphate transporter
MDGALALPLLVSLILVALIFDFLNGMNDAANSIATVVSTRVLRPQFAVLWAAFFNFVAFAVFGLHVADTVGRGIVEADIIDARVIFGALAGAIVWQAITNRLGIPSSSSHALIGGLVGAGLAKAGFSAVVWSGVFKTVSGIVLAPGLGCLTALLLMLLVSWLFIRFTPFGVDRFFRRAQLVSASLYSLGHGGNDAQKTMGIIAVLLYSQGYLGSQFHIPFWVVMACQAAIALGTLAGGWRIVKTMGSRITRLTPMQGFCAETGGSIMLFAATEFGIPVSTTHTITGCIVGVGAAKKMSAVRWTVAREIVTAWIVTIPASGFVAALFYYAVAIFSGGAITFLYILTFATVATLFVIPVALVSWLLLRVIRTTARAVRPPEKQ